MPTFPACILTLWLCSLPEGQDHGTNFFDVFAMNQTVAWICLVLNVPFWFAVYYYLDCVMPNSYGIQLHPCFCFRKGDEETERRQTYNAKVDDEAVNAKIYDDNDPILIDSLTKKFGNFTAVKDLKFSIRQGEVFTILGHNGAGKTTAIFMMTGMLKPTAGNAHLYGYDINNHIDIV